MTTRAYGAPAGDKLLEPLQIERRAPAAPEAIDRLAEIAAQVNERQENIGARRLQTVLERLLDTLNFDAPYRTDQVAIDRAYVHAHLEELVQDPN